MPKGASIILDGGTYYFKYLRVSEEIQVGRDTDGDCIVDVGPTTPVKIYVEGDVDLKSHGIVNGSFLPQDLQLYVLSNSDPVSRLISLRICAATWCELRRLSAALSRVAATVCTLTRPWKTT